jgi:hypothetical protein
MADPVTMLVVATAMQAVGSIAQANAQSSALKSQAAAARYNAEVSRQQSEQSLRVSDAQQRAQDRQRRQVMGNARAAAAQSNTGFGGSTGDVLERTSALSELDQLNLAYDGALRSRGYLAQADLDDYQARVYSQQAKTTKRLGYLNAATSIASGAAQISKMGGFGSPASTGAKSTLGLQPGGGLGLRPGGGLGLRYG